MFGGVQGVLTFVSLQDKVRSLSAESADAHREIATLKEALTEAQTRLTTTADKYKQQSDRYSRGAEGISSVCHQPNNSYGYCRYSHTTCELRSLEVEPGKSCL